MQNRQGRTLDVQTRNATELLRLGGIALDDDRGGARLPGAVAFLALPRQRGGDAWIEAGRICWQITAAPAGRYVVASAEDRRAVVQAKQAWCLDRFVRLWRGTDAAVLAFFKRYGPLGAAPLDVMNATTREPLRTWRAWSFALWSLALYAAHVRAVEIKGRALDAPVNVRPGRTFTPAALLRPLGVQLGPWFDAGRITMSPGHLLDWHATDAVEAWIALGGALDSLLEGARLREGVRIVADDDSGPAQVRRGRLASSALGMAARQLVDAVAGAQGSPGTCEACGADVDHLPKNGRRVWCSRKACQRHKERTHKADQRARDRQDA